MPGTVLVLPELVTKKNGASIHSPHLLQAEGFCAHCLSNPQNQTQKTVWGGPLEIPKEVAEGGLSVRAEDWALLPALLPGGAESRGGVRGSSLWGQVMGQAARCSAP